VAPDQDKLQRELESETRRLDRAERDRPTLLGQTVYLGTLGLVMVLPVVAGAYLGTWLDNQAEAYSVRWTISLLLVGLFIGAINVYLLIRE
jgi:ATP synthase protein I